MESVEERKFTLLAKWDERSEGVLLFIFLMGKVQLRHRAFLMRRYALVYGVIHSNIL